MKIYAIDGSEKSMAWLLSTWGIEIDSTLRRSGDKNFILTRVWEREGAAIYPVRVLNLQGVPWEGVVVGRTWPGAPNGWPGGTPPENVCVPPEAKNKAVFGITSSEGIASFGLGRGDYAAPGQGVTTIWIPSHFAGSDVVRKMGMMPGTNHRTLGLEFTLVQETEEKIGCIGGVLKWIWLSLERSSRS